MSISNEMNDKIHICSLLENKPATKRKSWLAYFKDCTLPNVGLSRSKKYFTSEVQFQRSKQIQITFHPYMIHPLSRFRTYYEMWMCIVYLLSLIYIPLMAMIATEKVCNKNIPGISSNNMPMLFIIDNILRILCCVDICVTFLTGHINDKGQIIMCPFYNAMHYIFSFWFVIDMISSIPFLNYIFSNTQLSCLIHILALLKIFRKITLENYLSEMADFLKSKVLKIFKSIISIILLLHWMTCVFFLVPFYHYFLNGQLSDKSWLIGFKVLSKPIQFQYLMCFNHVSNLMLAIGFLEIPSTIDEYLLNIFTIMYGRIICLFVVVQVVHVLMKVRRLEIKYFSTLEEIEYYMLRKRLPLQLRTQIVQYYQYKYNRKFFRETIITELLSEHLRKEITIHTCTNIIRRVRILADLPPRVIDYLLMQLKLEIYMPNDVVIKAGAIGDFMCFLLSGTVAVFTPSGKEVCHLHDGAYFGEIALVIRNMRRAAHVIAVEICQIYTLDRKSFKKCFNKYPDLLANIEQTARERMQETADKEYLHTYTNRIDTSI